MSGVRFRIFRRHKQSGLSRLESGTQDERAVCAKVRIDKELRKALGLRLGADKKGDAEYDAAKTQQQRAFPVCQEAQRNIERRPHFTFFSLAMSILRCLTKLPGWKRSWSDTMTCSPLASPL